MKDLIEKIGLDDGLKTRAVNLINNDEKRIITLCEQCHNTNFKAIAKCDDLTKLCVCVCYAATYSKQQYAKLGIGDDVFYATMQDIAIWCGNNQNRGLKNIFWIANHLNCELFRLGRLQYQLYNCKNKTFDYSALPFEYGDNTVFVHIPQGEKLVYADCVSSLKQAIKFFDTYFKNFDYQYFLCESWLLFEGNYSFMSPDSNILQFQSLFSIECNKADDRQAIERIFGKRQILKKRYAENTSLQKNAKAYMLSGGKLGMGVGIINKNEI